MFSSKDKNKSKDQCCSTELTGVKKQVEKAQDKWKGKSSEIIEHESPEVHSDKDPRF